MFIKYVHLLTGVVRDGNVDDVGTFVCLFKRVSEKLMMPDIVFLCL